MGSHGYTLPYTPHFNLSIVGIDPSATPLVHSSASERFREGVFPSLKRERRAFAHASGSETNQLAVTPEEKAEVSPVASVSVAVMRGFVPVTVVVVVKSKFCDPVVAGVTVSDPM